MSNSFDLDHDLSGLIWVQTVCKGYRKKSLLARKFGVDKIGLYKEKMIVNQKHFNHIYNIRGIAHNYVKIFKKLILVPQNQFTHL